MATQYKTEYNSRNKSATTMSSSEESERRETGGRGSRRIESDESSRSHTGGEGGFGGTRQGEAIRGEAEDNVRRRQADPWHRETRLYGGQSGRQNANDMSRERQFLNRPSHGGAANATTRTEHDNDSGDTHGQEHELDMAASRASRNPLLGGMPPSAAARTAVQSWSDQYGQRDLRALEAQLRMSASSLYPPLYQHPQPPWFGQYPANMPFIGNYQTAPTFGDGTAFASLLRDLSQGGGLNLQNLQLGAVANPPSAAAASYGDTSFDYSGAMLRQPPVNPPQNVARYPSQSVESGSTTNVQPAMKPNRVKKRGVLEPFPERLHRLLREVEAAGQSDVISFTHDGRAFEIHKPTEFFRDICQVYFRQSRLSSFKRQLNLYGFELIARGPNKGGYFHEYFQRDRPEIVRQIRRTSYKSKKKQMNANSAPDFYSMPPITSHEEAERKAASGSSNGSGGSADDGDKKMPSSDSRKTEASDSNGSGFYSDMRPMGYNEEESEGNSMLISDISDRGAEEIEKEMARTNSGSTEEEERKGMEITTHSGSIEEEEQGDESRSS